MDIASKTKPVKSFLFLWKWSIEDIRFFLFFCFCTKEIMARDPHMFLGEHQVKN